MPTIPHAFDCLSQYHDLTSVAKPERVSDLGIAYSEHQDKFEAVGITGYVITTIYRHI